MVSYETKRFFIRPVVEQDRDFYCQLHTDAKVMEHISAPLSLSKANKAFDTTLKQMANAKAHNSTKVLAWIVIEKKTNTKIAYQALSWYLHSQAKTDPLFNTQGQPEVGIILSSQHQGKGYAVEAMGSLIEYAFKHLGYDIIHLFYYQTHQATKHFLNKLHTIIDHNRQPQDKAWEYQYLLASRWENTYINKFIKN